MRALITGGFGYIGAKLGEYLFQNGHEVVLGTQRILTAPDWLPQVEVVNTIWNDEKELTKICQGFDVIVHAAGMNAEDCLNDPVRALEFNGLVTSRILRSAIQSGIKKFVYLSTAHVYRNPLEGIINENTCAINIHPYATSHLAAEFAISHETSKNRIEGISLRISNGFGAPKESNSKSWMLLVNDLCRQAVTQGRLKLRTSGGQKRDFIPLSTIAERILKILTFPSEQLPQIVNIGSGKSLSVMEMALLIQQRCKVVLNIDPKIEIGEEKELKNNFEFRSLYNSQFEFKTPNLKQSIDETLVLCKTIFN